MTTILARNPSAVCLQERQGYSLYIEPQTGQWAVLDRDASGILASYEGGHELAHPSEVLEPMIDTNLLVPLDWRPPDCPPYVCNVTSSSHELRLLLLYVTTRCNLRCQYCYAAQAHTEQDMDLATVEDATKRFLQSTQEEQLAVEFTGGEPFLCWDLLKESTPLVHHLADVFHKEVTVRAQTNGLLLTRDIVRWCRNNKLHLGLSIDPKANGSTPRRYPHGGDSIHEAESAWPLLHEYRESRGVVSVILKPEDYLSALDWGVKHRVRWLKACVAGPVGRARATGVYFRQEDMVSRSEYHLEMFHRMLDHNEAVGSDELAIREVNIQYLLEAIVGVGRYMCHSSPCGAGSAQLNVFPDGKLYACGELALPHLAVGDLADPRLLTEQLDNSPVIQMLRSRRVDRISECRTCPVRPFCKGDCSAKTYWAFGSFDRPGYSCEYYRHIIPELMWDFHFRKEEVLNYMRPAI